MINYSINNPYLKYIFSEDNFTDISISYFCGFLSHYILDRSIHPYIFYLQSYLKKQYKLKSNNSLHKSIETHIDSLLLYKLKKSTPNIFIKNININLSNNEIFILCDMYNFLLRYVFDKSISYNDIHKSLCTFKKTQIRLIYYNNIYSKLYLFIKNLLCKTSYIENRIYSKHTQCVNDLLNEKKSIWTDPFSKEKQNKSLLNMYYDSLILYQEIVNIFYQYIHNNKKMMDIINKIENKSYVTNQDFSTSSKINL